MALTASDRFHQGRFIDLGDGSDLDEAFEDAVEGARVEYGLSGVVPSVASLSASDVTELELPPVPHSRAELELERSLSSAPPGTALARAVARDTSFARRRVMLKIEDPSAPLADLADRLGQRLTPTAEVEQWLLAQLPQEVALRDGEFLESVELRAWRPRFKPLATSNKGKRSNTFVAVLAGTHEPLATGATAGEARRNAVALARTGALGTLESYELEVLSTTRFEDGTPLASVRRERVALRATLRLTLASEKKPGLTKTTGWLFGGTVAVTGPEVGDGEGSEQEDSA